MAISSTDIQKLYIIFFNRPADVDGLAFWTTQHDFRAVARAMTTAPEYVAAYAGLSHTAIVTVFYQNLFERLPDAEGLAFWVDALDRRALDAGGLAVVLASVAHDRDGTVLTHKASLANSFTSALDTPARKEIYELNLGARIVKTLVDSVGADSDSLLSAQHNVVPTINALFPVKPSAPADVPALPAVPALPPPLPPATAGREARLVAPDPSLAFTLTVGQDHFSGGRGDDSFSGVVGSAGGRTYDVADVLDGGAGTDTLSLSIDRDLSINGSSIRNVERLSINTSAPAAIAFDNVAGMTELVNQESTRNLQFGTEAGGVNALVTLVVNSGTADTTLRYTPAALNGNADGNYLVSAYDMGHAKMVVALVSPGTNSVGNTTLNRADMTDTGIAVMGVLDMSLNDYKKFDGTQLGTAV